MTDVKLWLLYSNTCNHLTHNLGSFQNGILKMGLQITYIYKQESWLNYQEWFICHKTLPNEIKPK